MLDPRPELRPGGPAADGPRTGEHGAAGSGTPIGSTLLDRLTSIRLQRSQAIGLSLALTALATTGDFLTTAETAFTVFYLAPIGLATWHVGSRFGYLVVLLCTLGTLTTDVFAATRPPEPAYVAWNTAIEGAIFLVVLSLVHALRTRLDVADHLRHEAEDAQREAERLRASSAAPPSSAEG